MNILEIVTSKEIPQPKSIISINDEINLCKRLGLKNQELMLLAEQKGTRIIRRYEIHAILGIPEDKTYKINSISEFDGKIPFGVLCKIDQFKEDPLFWKLSIIAPAETVQSKDPLLIGEILTSESDKDRLFFRRNTIVALIAKWE